MVISLEVNSRGRTSDLAGKGVSINWQVPKPPGH
jgi:hypothetical protein